jgi:uncharacterized Zn-binding protein involved in type VI secretion
MGKPACRVGDMCSGHGCYPPRPAVEGSDDVFINDRSAHREGDEWATHHCPHHDDHSGSLVKGSSTVRINGRGAGRIGDRVSCGSVAVTGSHNVLIGD